MGRYGVVMGPLGWLAIGVVWLVLLGLVRWLVVRLLPGCGVPATRPTDESQTSSASGGVGGMDPRL